MCLPAEMPISIRANKILNDASLYQKAIASPSNSRT